MNNKMEKIARFSGNKGQKKRKEKRKENPHSFK